MKIRNGFVSNSSSSSFVIGVKGYLTPEKVIKSFSVAEESPFFNIFLATASTLCEHADEMSISHYKDEHYQSEFNDVLKEIEKQNLKLYAGSIASYGDGGNALDDALARTRISYRSNDLIIEKGNSW